MKTSLSTVCEISITIVILPKRDVGLGGFLTGVAFVELPDLRLCSSKNSNADVFDSQ